MVINAETQYSIYKINIELVTSVFKNIAKGKNKKEYLHNIVQILINSIVKIFKTKNNSKIRCVSHNGLNGVIVKATHYPAWTEVAKQMMTNSSKTKNDTLDYGDINNTNVSYVYFCIYNGNIFAVTGGYGSNYISKFTEKNFGLYLLPKLIQKDNSVIKSIQQNNLLGNQTASQRTNKNSTSIYNEQDMSSIFRQLSIEATRDIAESLGIKFQEDESPNKKINIVNKDSIVIHRSITIEELKRIIGKISQLEKNKDNFSLNYFVLARKKDLKTQELNEALLDALMSDSYDNFILTGDDYTTFLTCANTYAVCDKNTNKILLEQESPIDFLSVINLLERKSKTAFNGLLKNWTISTLDNSGNCIQYPITIYDALQGFIEFGEKHQPCYLFNGNWYVIDTRFSDSLTQDFGELYETQKQTREQILNDLKLLRESKTEEEYNETLRKEGDVLVSHKALVDNIEIADIIFFKENEMYLMHNKDSFNGKGSRDVVNQVLTSAEYLQRVLSSAEKDEFIERYYNSIESKYLKQGIKIPLDKETFKTKFYNTTNKHYIIGYLTGYNKNSTSEYAKYLTLEVVKKLTNKGYKCTSLLITNSNNNTESINQL